MENEKITSQKLSSLQKLIAHESPGFRLEPCARDEVLMALLWENLWLASDWAKSILALLGLGGVTIGGSAAVAYGLFRWLGKSWIEGKFERQLESFKAEQSQELERLRHRINGVFDRTIRLHTKEFEVLPDLWGKLVDAHAWVGGYISRVQTFPDVSGLDDEELDEVLDGTKFLKFQKRDIRNARVPMERQSLFNKYGTLHRYNGAQERVRLLGTGLRKEGIFLKPEIKADMETIFDVIQKAMMEKRVNDENEVIPRPKVYFLRFQNEAEVLMIKIEKAVGDRLWDSTTAEV